MHTMTYKLPCVVSCCCCSYMEPVYASMGLVEQGRKLLLLDKLGSLTVNCPVRILHGVQVRGQG